MKTNKLDKNIKEKLENRRLQPSNSAWERLSIQLDEQPKKKKLGWFFYIGVAASILLLISVGIQVFSNDSEVFLPNDKIVVSPNDKNTIDDKIEEFVKEIPVQEALVNKEEIINKKEHIFKNIISDEDKFQQSKVKLKSIKKEKIVIAKVEEKNIINVISTEIEKSKVENSKILKQDPNSTIKINADDLLYAVTHSPKEVKEYYAKYDINREDVLKTIKNELKKSNIKVNPNTILAEVERTINDDDFQNNFMKSLKSKISNIATAIASRNN